MNKPLNLEEFQKKKCEWSLKKDSKNGKADPHIHTKWQPPKKMYNSIIDAIGNTPMIKLNNIPKAEGIQCEIFAKCEYFNPGGSMKDRISRRMIDDGIKKGEINDETVIIEATSGNTGIGLGMIGAAKKQKVMITITEKMSTEKINILKALGCEVVVASCEPAIEDEDSYMGIAMKKNKEIHNSVLLDQYSNESNALVHFDETAEEIWEQCDRKIDYLVIGAGTGGTITGVGRKMKERNPDIQIIGVDSHGSILAYPERLNVEGVHPYKVEGIGDDFIPRNCDRTQVVDKWIKVSDKESFLMAKRIIREEGFLVGGSSGSVLQASLQVAKDLPKDKRVVTIFVDSIRNYLTKFINDEWLLENNIITKNEYYHTYFEFDSNELPFNPNDKISMLSMSKVEPLQSTATVQRVIAEFAKQKVECVSIRFYKSVACI